MAGAFAALASVVSGVFAVALFRRWRLGGRRNTALLLWSLALGMFFTASLALAEGAMDGWGEGSFRLFYLFGAVLNVPWLAHGSVHINADDRVVSRTVGGVVAVIGVATLVPGALADGTSRGVFLLGGAIALVWGLLHWLLEGDALRTASLVLVAAFSGAALASVPVAVLTGPVEAAGGALPEGRELFPAIPRGLAFGGNTAGSMIVIVGALTAAVRQRGTRPGLARGNALIGVGVAIAGAGGAFSFLGESVGHAVGLGLGVVVMYAGFALAVRPAGAAADAATVAPGSPDGARGGGAWR